MKEFLIRLGLILLALLTSVYFGFQIYTFFTPSFGTEKALSYTVTEDVTVSGFLVRSEQIVTTDARGVFDYAVEDGQRVPNGGRLASVYESADDVDRSEQIKQLDDRIALLKQSGDESQFVEADISRVEEQIGKDIVALAGRAAAGVGSEALQYKDTLTLRLNQKQLILGETAALEEKLSELESQRDSLKAQRKPSVKEIYSPAAGYFVASTDGAEEMLLPGNVDKLTVEDLTSLSKLSFGRGEKEGVVGKIISGFEWYYACLVTPEEVEGLKDGSGISLRFPFALGTSVPATVRSISAAKDGKCVLVLQSSYMFDEVEYLRNQTVQLIRRSHTGLRISRRALHVQDGVTGVYAVIGSVLTFKPVEILYSKDNYVIVKADTKSGSLLLYDEVVVRGKDLYDGKVVR